MTKLIASLSAWNTENFNQCLKSEIKNLESGTLPLHLCTTQGGIVDDTNLSISIINSNENSNEILIKTAVFFNEIVGGCSCGDDPVSENAYGEILITINKQTAESKFAIITQ